MTPGELFRKWNRSVRKECKYAFAAAVVIALLIHMPVMLSDIPNHDGLDSIYFDQNMITSGRWFLMIACGLSSFYSLPWVIGLIGILFLGIAAALLTEILQVRHAWAAVLVGGLLVSFPALASTFAYVFTLDGYMLGLLLAVTAVFLTGKYRKGFLAGAVCLAFSMGTYQAYLPFAMILSVFAIWMLLAREGSNTDKFRHTLRYLYMGAGGAALYYLLLRILLAIQGKQLASYQGINGMTSGAASGGLLTTVLTMYRDFFAFTLKGKVLYNNKLSALAFVLLFAAALVVFEGMVFRRKWWKNPRFLFIIVLSLAGLPLATNVILFISPSVTYHLLMRYQWVLYLIGAVAFVSNREEEHKGAVAGQWLVLIAAVVLIFAYGVTDNIGYSNLNKRYEKTYAYCVRLLDRIEQTEGYYPGIPVAMIGVVGDEQYPLTDVTQDVTSNLIGLGGDMLLYTGRNYEKFIRNYLGATLNILPAEAMAEMYYDERYVEMQSFPGEDSIRIIDGIMYIKTENVNR